MGCDLVASSESVSDTTIASYLLVRIISIYSLDFATDRVQPEARTVFYQDLLEANNSESITESITYASKKSITYGFVSFCKLALSYVLDWACFIVNVDYNV
jgi:hypothetical protein